MTTLQEAARDALEALERIGKDFVCRSAHHAKKDQHSAFAECPVVVRHTDAIESLKAALAQQGEQAKPAAYITDTWQGPMVWTPEMYGEACTYCDDGEFPVPLYTANQHHKRRSAAHATIAMEPDGWCAIPTLEPIKSVLCVMALDMLRKNQHHKRSLIGY